MNNLPGLNFQLGDDIDALRDAVREFAQKEIAPAPPTSTATTSLPMPTCGKSWATWACTA
jgi:isovaleryl-CoA dehydrogenase